MMTAYEGEDVPLTISYVDDAGSAIDPDDPGTTWPSIEIIDESDESTALTGTVMTQNGTGEFEYVWDTEADANGAGTYRVEVTAEFSTETKISKTRIELE